VSLAFFLFLYKFVPLYLATSLGKFYPVLQGHVAQGLVDGMIRIAIFLAFFSMASRALRTSAEYSSITEPSTRWFLTSNRGNR
jgi:hypothetical protein